MFLFLLFATFVVALLVSFVVMCLFAKPIDSVLRRIIADEISVAWSKYLKFPMLGGREVQTVSLGFDRWVFEIYRTAIETLQGIAWMLLVFFVFALLAFVFVRLGELRREHRDQPAGSQEQSV